MKRQTRKAVSILMMIIGGIVNAGMTVAAGIVWMKMGNGAQTTYTGALITIVACIAGGCVGSRLFGFVAYFKEDRCPFKVDLATRIIGGAICTLGLFVYRQQTLAQYSMSSIEVAAIVGTGVVFILVETVICTIENVIYIRGKKRAIMRK